MAFDNEQHGDARVSVGSLEFLVDPTSAEALEGASIDWVENVMNSGFAITAPNAPKAAGGGGCGCGANEAHGAPQASAGGGWGWGLRLRWSLVRPALESPAAPAEGASDGLSQRAQAL